MRSFVTFVAFFLLTLIVNGCVNGNHDVTWINPPLMIESATCSVASDCVPTVPICYSGNCYPLGGEFIPPPWTGTLPTSSALNYTKLTWEYKPGLLADVYIPKTGVVGGVKLLIHGGGGVSGDRVWLGGFMPLIAGGYTSPAKKWITVSIDYRLASVGPGGIAVNAFPAALIDVSCAIRRIVRPDPLTGVSPANSWGGSNAGLWVEGYSVGATLGMLAVETQGWSEFPDGTPVDDGLCPVAVQSSDILIVRGVGYYYGVSDYSVQVASWVPIYIGKTVGSPEYAAAIFNASPINWFHPGIPPVAVAHGTSDPTVNYTQSVALVAAAKAAGVDATLATAVGGVHLAHSLQGGVWLTPNLGMMKGRQ